KEKTLTDEMSDTESIYEQFCVTSPNSGKVIFQNIQKIGGSDSLFYTPVTTGSQVTLGAMLDSGSMACTLSGLAEQKLNKAGILSDQSQTDTDIVLVGCRGNHVHPKCAYDIEMEVYGHRLIVPTLVVHEQCDELILGTNVIKHILHQFKQYNSYWRTMSKPDPDIPLEGEKFLGLLSGLTRWKGRKIPEKNGTSMTYEINPLDAENHIKMASLPEDPPSSPNSTVMVEPTAAQSAPRNILVGHVIISMWGDRWVPMRIINTSDKSVTLRRNSKVADVYPCLAHEDIEMENSIYKGEKQLNMCHQQVEGGSLGHTCPPALITDPEHTLKEIALGDLNIKSSQVSNYWKEQLASLVVQYKYIFSQHHLDCGDVKGFVHQILTDEKPFRLPYCRVPLGHYLKIRQVLNEMEEKDIRKSGSEFASSLVLVWKKNGDLRIYTDFRWLNARTVKDAYPLPHQADCLAALGGNAFFSTMDLTSGFYNVSLHEEDRKYSAFTTPMGLYEYNRLPQGLCNSPASFMCMMTNILGDQNCLSLLCYLDDLLVFAPTEETALNRLRSHNMKLAPKKYCFMIRTVKFLGHIIDVKGVAIDPGKVDAITSICKEDLMELDGVTPSQKKIRSFLGMVNYYQHFIENCSAIAKPLFNLTAGQKGRRGKTKSPKQAVSYRQLTATDWTPVHKQAFADLKTALLNCALLAHPDFSRPFILSTDASLDGLGAVLSQIVEGEQKVRPIAFASKSLTKAQSKYPAHRLEFLALKWAVCNKLSHWLKGHSFMSWEPFVKGKVSHRLLSEPYGALVKEAERFSTDVVQDLFRLSNNSQVVPDLGRMGCFENGELRSFSREEVMAVLENHTEWELSARSRAAGLVQHIQQTALPGQDALPVFIVKELQEKLADSVISRVIYYVEMGHRPSRRKKGKELAKVLRFLRQWGRLKICNGILYRVSKDHLKKKHYQYVVPEILKKQVLQEIHDDAGHQGQFCTLNLARQQFFWLSLDNEVKDYVRCCKRCVVSNTAEPECIKMTAPLEMTHFFPIHSPMGNGTAEHFNRTLGNIIQCLLPRTKQKWAQTLQTLTFAYNCTVHETTRYPPFYLMYGRVPGLPVDVMYCETEVVNYDKYVVSLMKDLQEALTLAQGHAIKEQQRQTRIYNQRVKGINIEMGDWILLANKGERDRRKTADRWESTIYVVVNKNSKTLTGQEKVVHRNLLMLANFLPL
uniref:Gypsy retrotransposon integrase-like protein 1 n=1 Tax=Latimeria chalumnae TaxID=7897 RepID=H3A9W5_LATCH